MKPAAGSAASTRRWPTCTHSNEPSWRRSWCSPLQRPASCSPRSDRPRRRLYSAALLTNSDRWDNANWPGAWPVSRLSASLARWMRSPRTKAMPTSETLNISSRSRASASSSSCCALSRVMSVNTATHSATPFTWSTERTVSAHQRWPCPGTSVAISVSKACCWAMAASMLATSRAASGWPDSSSCRPQPTTWPALKPSRPSKRLLQRTSMLARR